MRTFNTLLGIILLFLSCKRQQERPQTIEGTWQSIGSGWILDIKDSTAYEIFDVTPISCISNRKGKVSEIQQDLSLKNDTLSLLKGVITYQFTRTQVVPQLCSLGMTEEKKRDPLYNFDVFAETVQEHYAFMELNAINWDSIYQVQKGRLQADPSDVKLYQVLEETLEILNDNHAYLEATDEVYAALEQQETSQPEESEESATEALPEYGDLQVAGMVKDHHLQEEMTKDSKLIQWGSLTDTIGYIQIMTMWLHADLDIPQTLIDEKGYLDAYVDTFHEMYEGDYIKMEAQTVRDIIDRALKDLADKNAIVMDVRFNGGGQDAVSFEILNRFTKDRIQIANQKLYYNNQFSPSLPLYLSGSADAYTKPVYVLTSPQTGSAAESFAIATMAMPHIRRIGSATSGAMSTALEKTLPNGWGFSISNEIYMDLQGTFYENKGVPVDYELHYSRERQPFFRSVAQDLGKDKNDILRAIEALEQ